MKIKYNIIAFVVIGVLGTISHFIYEWSDFNRVIGYFFAINESTWEHLKLLFFPMLITIIIGNFLFNKNYICIKSKGLIWGMIFIVVFFYTYTGILGFNIPILDIGSFIVAVIISEIYTYKNIDNNSCSNKVWILVLLIFILSFFIFTFNTPKIGIFKDPVTESYGIKEKERNFLSN